MEKVPFPGTLYRKIAKDYNPKAAEMAICKYIQEMEIKHDAQITELFARVTTLETAPKSRPAGPVKATPPKED